MSRIPYPDPDSLPPPAQEALDALPKRLNIVRAVSQAPTILPEFMSLALSFLRELKLSPRHRELLILLVGRYCECDYEIVHHSPVALACGVSESELENLLRGEIDTWHDKTERALLSSARDLLKTCTISMQSIEGLRSHFSDRQIVEAILLVGYYRMIAGLANGLDIEVDPQGNEMIKAVNIGQ